MIFTLTFVKHLNGINMDQQSIETRNKFIEWANAHSCSEQEKEQMIYDDMRNEADYQDSYERSCDGE